MKREGVSEGLALGLITLRSVAALFALSLMWPAMTCLLPLHEKESQCGRTVMG